MFAEFEKNRRTLERQTKGDMKKWETTQIFEVVDGGTKVSATVDYEFPYSVLGKIIDKLKGEKDVSDYIHTFYRNAKRILEKEKA